MKYRDGIILYFAVLIFFSIWALIFNDIIRIIKQSMNWSLLSNASKCYFEIMNLRDLIPALIIIFFKRNEDMISDFSKVDDMARISIF